MASPFLLVPVLALLAGVDGGVRSAVPRPAPARATEPADGCGSGCGAAPGANPFAPPPVTKPTVHLFVPRTEGALQSPPAVTALEKSRAAFVACYRHSLAEEPTLRGKVVLDVDVAATGRVTKVTVTADQVGHQLAACASARVPAVVFPKAAAASLLVVVLQFDDLP